VLGGALFWFFLWGWTRTARRASFLSNFSENIRGNKMMRHLRLFPIAHNLKTIRYPRQLPGNDRAKACSFVKECNGASLLHINGATPNSDLFLFVFVWFFFFFFFFFDTTCLTGTKLSESQNRWLKSRSSL
jgi:hypothetical protein